MTRVVLFGATGYTGRLTAEAMVAAGVGPVLAGRDPARLEALAGRLGGLPVAEADTARPDSVRDLVGAGDVLVSTVGPFMLRGEPAVRAAVDAGATYLDCTGEPPFVRRVFSELGPRAAGRCRTPACPWLPRSGELLACRPRPTREVQCGRFVAR